MQYITNIFATNVSSEQLFQATATVALAGTTVRNRAQARSLPDHHIAAICTYSAQTPALFYKIRQMNLAMYASKDDEGMVVIAAEEGLTEGEVMSFLDLIMVLATRPVDPVSWLVKAAEDMSIERFGAALGKHLH